MTEPTVVMKYCNRCCQHKPETEFNFQNKAKGIRLTYCCCCVHKSTRRQYGREYYIIAARRCQDRLGEPLDSRDGPLARKYHYIMSQDLPCTYCGKVCRCEVGHLNGIDVDGNDPNLLQPECRECNRAKRLMTHEEFMQYRDFRNIQVSICKECHNFVHESGYRVTNTDSGSRSRVCLRCELEKKGKPIPSYGTNQSYEDFPPTDVSENVEGIDF